MSVIYRPWIAAITALHLAMPVWGNITCKAPFAGQSQQFDLRSPVSCSGSSSPSHNLTLTHVTNPGDGAPYYAAGCYGASKFLNLYWGKTTMNGKEYDFVVDWSDGVEGKKNVFKFMRSCDGQAVGVVDANPGSLNIKGSNIAVAYRLFANNLTSTLLAYAPTAETTSIGLTLMSPNGDVLTQAHKTYVEKDGQCAYNWQVQNRELDPSLVGAVLAWKDNDPVECTPVTPVVPAGAPVPSASGSKGFSSPSVLTALVITGVATGVVSAATVIYCILKRHRQAAVYLRLMAENDAP